MPLMRLLGILLLSLLLTACGGGGSIEKSGTVGDTDTDTDTTTYTLTLQGYSQADATKSNSVTNTAALDLRATLKDNDGAVVAGPDTKRWHSNNRVKCRL